MSKAMAVTMFAMLIAIGGRESRGGSAALVVNPGS
jgi:hypothetical protein